MSRLTLIDTWVYATNFIEKIQQVLIATYFLPPFDKTTETYCQVEELIKWKTKVGDESRYKADLSAISLAV